MATTLDRIKADRRVEFVDDERSCGNGLLVTLKPGWTFDAMCDNRVAGEDTVSALFATVRRAQPYSGELTA